MVNAFYAYVGGDIQSTDSSSDDLRLLIKSVDSQLALALLLVTFFTNDFSHDVNKIMKWKI